MLSLWSDTKLKIYVILLFVLLGAPCIWAGADVDQRGEDVTNVQDSSIVCDPKCGCDGVLRLFVYDEAKDQCVVNWKLMKTVIVRYNNQDDDSILATDGMAKSIYIEGQKIFRGIMISVLLFMTCASICVLSACLYCCRINYSDRKLKNEVKALAKKMNKSYNPKTTLKSKVTEPKAQSCNVVVEEAGVFVV